MKNFILAMISIISIGCHAKIIFMDADTLNAFNTALISFEKKHLRNYSVFIDDDNENVVVFFIENGVTNPGGRPVAYGKGIEYKIQKKQT